MGRNRASTDGYQVRRSPVQKKRPGKPRRGRVVDKEFLEWVAEQPCLVHGDHSVACIRWMDGITIHHVRRNGEPKSDRRVIPLCPATHLHDFGPESIERLGKKEFEKRHGIDIEAAILRYNEEYESQQKST